MTVLILGFSNLNRLAAEMEKLISASNFFLFNVCVGGVGDCRSNQPTIAEQWAILNGAPLKRVCGKDFNHLVWLLEREVDYIIFDAANAPPPAKQILMKLKAAGKHGTIVR